MRKHSGLFRARLPKPTRGFFLLGLLALGNEPTAALPRPSIGLTAHGAQLLLEEGPDQHAPGAGNLFGAALASGDFNLDGHDDLAIGVPWNSCSGAGSDCGSVQVRFGGTWGLSPALVLDPDGVGQFGDAPPEPSIPGDIYGAALASGDFNHDGYADLAVGIPNNLDDDLFRSGGVQIHYGLHGSIGSIQWVAEHFLDQLTAGVPSDPVGAESFGQALAAGDFNGDGHDDLAIGVPGDVDNSAPQPRPRTGSVSVLHGHIGGLFPVEAFQMLLGVEGLPDTGENGESFGYAVAAGDFNGDGFDDLAISVPGEDGVGAVLVTHGSPNSLIFANHLYFGLFDLGATPQDGSRFGHSLAVGDFDDDGHDDLAVGAPMYDDVFNGEPDVGMLAVVYGSQEGLATEGAHLYWEDLLGTDASEPGDRFGIALAAGDFNADGVDDLAIGADSEDISLFGNAGAVTVRLGVAGQGAAGAARQLSAGLDRIGILPGPRTPNSRWGAALVAGDFDGNGFADLATGAPERDTVETPENAGAVGVSYGQLFIDGFETGDAMEWD